MLRKLRNGKKQSVQSNSGHPVVGYRFVCILNEFGKDTPKFGFIRKGKFSPFLWHILNERPVGNRVKLMEYKRFILPLIPQN